MIHHYDRATADERGKRTEEVCNRNFAQNNRQGKGGKQNKQCSKCGKKGHTNKECLSHIECYFCQKKGHYEKDCRTKKAAENAKT